MYRITIREGKEKLLVKHHPWVFSGAVESVEPSYSEPGFAEVCKADGAFIAYGYYDERSHIILHLLSWRKQERMDGAFIRRLTRDAVTRRRRLFSLEGTTAFRLIHGEADFLPGVAADCYGREIRIIVSSRFADAFLPEIAAELDSILHPSLIAASPDPAFLQAEGLRDRTRLFREGKEQEAGDERQSILFKENGIYYELPPGKGQKSGFYCDQRDNREAIEKHAKGRRVLDVCSFTGGFTLHALRAGAESVKAVDSSESALRHLLYQVHINEDRNAIPEGSRDKVSIESADCFEYMRSIGRNEYDMMILDPPKLAKTKGQLESARKAYKDLNRLAMEKIADGGIIATFSCSGAMTREEFLMTLSWAAKDAGVEVQVLETLSAGEDHPVRLSFPESEYLKGYILRILR